MSMSKEKASIVPLAEDHQEMNESTPDEAISPSSAKSINDLPPELLTKVLEFVTLDDNRNTMLGYRLVSSQWKDIVDSLIEKKVVTFEFPVFPKMAVVCGAGQLGLRVSPERFSLGGNPFPFNSLNFKGTEHPWDFKIDASHLPMLSLEAFASNFGRNLTTFSLSDQKLPINTIILMLAPMQNLKRLRFENVIENTSRTELDAVLRNPPLLPCLTTIEVEAGCSSSGDGIDILYLWLIASYAEQLELLYIQSNDPFPPLQASYEYTHSFPSGESCSIATTSEFAFGKLKQLKIFDPTREFLILSETPALRLMSLENIRKTRFHLEDLITFIKNCSSTLETLIMDIKWTDLISGELMYSYLDGVQPEITAGSEVPTLKTLRMHYPDEDWKEIVFCNFLVKFPALEVLQLVWFRPFSFDSMFLDWNIHECLNLSTKTAEFENGNNKIADEIVTLKERLALLFQQMCWTQRNKREVKAAIKIQWEDLEAFWREEEDENAAAAPMGELEAYLMRMREYEAARMRIRELEAEIEYLQNLFKSDRDNRIKILERLSALGENTNEIEVHQLLERGGFWNTCPNLRIVSASSRDTPDGKICLARRADLV